MIRRIAAALPALLLCGAFTGTCAQSPRDSRPPAAPVPTHVVTESDAAKTVAAEQGDALEVRLPETDGTWRLSEITGDARLDADGESRAGESGGVRMRVFRFRALQIGVVLPDRTVSLRVGDDAGRGQRHGHPQR